MFYTEEKFIVQGVNGRKVQVVYDRIKDADTGELFMTLRIQEIEPPKATL